jgi:hypothetical protein
MTNSSFSAANPALGYLYQVRYALWRLLDSSDDAAVRIECLDDISIESANQSLYSLKHLDAARVITVGSKELWTTLRIWSERLKAGEISLPSDQLVMVTTSQISGEALQLLSVGNPQRDASRACQLFTDWAESHNVDEVKRDGSTGPKNKTLRPAYAAFLSLNASQRLSLVGAISITAKDVDIEAIKEGLKRKLRDTVKPKHLDSHIQRVEGLWFQWVVLHLYNKGVQPLRRLSLQLALLDMARQFDDDNLPIDFIGAVPPPELDFSSRRFVSQLESISLQKNRIRSAIHDYYRAYEQRSKWVREDLIVDSDLLKYELRLVEEWRRYADSLLQECQEEMSEEDCKALGRKLYNWVEFVACFPLRPKIVEPYVLRGTYQMLADEPLPRVYWHPKFIDRLQNLLTVDGQNDQSTHVATKTT